MSTCCGPFVPAFADGGGGGATTIDQGVAISAGTQLASTGTVIFSNSNAISFGMSASTLTASFAAIRAISGGTTQATGSQVVFANGSGVSFGVNGNTVTASVAAFTQSTAPGAISAGTTLASSGTVVFSNAGNVTFGMAGNTVTATASFPAQVPFAISAGTQSVSTGTLVFSNSNGVSFGMSGNSRITASFEDISYQQFAPYIGGPIQTAAVLNGSVAVYPENVPNLVFSQWNPLLYYSNVSNSTGTVSVSYQLGVYTKNASTLSLLMSTSVSFSIPFSGTASASLYNGIRLVTTPWTSTLSKGAYWFAALVSTTNSSDNASFRLIYRDMVPPGGSSVFSGQLGVVSSTTNQMQLGFGHFSASTAALPNSIGFNEIRGSLYDRCTPAFGLGATA